MALADLTPGQHADRVRNHWWWRPGWRVGRRFYAFHVTFDGQHQLHERAQAYRSVLTETPGLTLIPDRWLHLTVQGVGFTDELSGADMADIAAGARSLLADIPFIAVSLGHVVVADEAIVLPVKPAEPVCALRRLLRLAISRVLGDENVSEPADRFRPHVSVAYTTSEGSADPYIEAVGRAPHTPVPLTIRHVDLIAMNRDNQMYEWQTVTALPLKP